MFRTEMKNEFLEFKILIQSENVKFRSEIHADLTDFKTEIRKEMKKTLRRNDSIPSGNFSMYWGYPSVHCNSNSLDVWCDFGIGRFSFCD
jgi:hypothetical protein